MAKTTYIFRFFILLFLSLGSKASVIHFEAYPAVLKSNLTEAASMRCSLADTSPGSTHIGRSVSSTSDNVLHISSIHVMMNDKEVASITPFDAATAMVGQGNLEVKGQLTGADSTGYIELSWKNAAAMALGEYVCEVETINANHQTVEFKSSLEMTAISPTINDVIQEFKSKMQAQEQTIKAMDQKLTSAVDKLKACTSQRNGFMAVISTFPLASGREESVAVNQPVVFDKVIYSIGGGYDASSGIFTCTQPGIYFFSAHVVSYSGQNICIHVKVNNQTATALHAYDVKTLDTGSSSVLLHLKTQDTVHLVTAPGCTAEFYSDGNVLQANVFTGHLTHSDECVV